MSRSRHGIRLEPNPYITGAEGDVTVTWRVQGPQQAHELSYTVRSEARESVIAYGRGEPALAATLLAAMRSGTSLHCHGQVSPALLEGLEHLQRIWHRWRPGRYQMVALSADEEVEHDHRPVGRTGLFAFSGGVDGTFSLLRHHHGHDLGRIRIKPAAALLVGGLDIPQERADLFDAVAARAQRMLSSTGVPLLRMRTNFRQLGQAWEDAFGLGLASCMLLLSGQFAFGVHGSGEPYERLVFPWGSTPLTDPLLRTDSFGVVHDGADYDRTEKVEWLVRNAPPKSLST